MPTKLEQILFSQGDRCFFCNNKIAKDQQSIEHLVAKKNGGSNNESNCVVCCKTLNQLLGAKSIKEKIEILMKHPPKFTCPNNKNNKPKKAKGKMAQRAKNGKG